MAIITNAIIDIITLILFTIKMSRIIQAITGSLVCGAIVYNKQIGDFINGRGRFLASSKQIDAAALNIASKAYNRKLK